MSASTLTSTYASELHLAFDDNLIPQEIKDRLPAEITVSRAEVAKYIYELADSLAVWALGSAISEGRLQPRSPARACRPDKGTRHGFGAVATAI